MVNKLSLHVNSFANAAYTYAYKRKKIKNSLEKGVNQSYQITRKNFMSNACSNCIIVGLKSFTNY